MKIHATFYEEQTTLTLNPENEAEKKLLGLLEGNDATVETHLEYADYYHRGQCVATVELTLKPKPIVYK